MIVDPRTESACTQWLLLQDSCITCIGLYTNTSPVLPTRPWHSSNIAHEQKGWLSPQQNTPVKITVRKTRHTGQFKPLHYTVNSVGFNIIHTEPSRHYCSALARWIPSHAAPNKKSPMSCLNYVTQRNHSKETPHWCEVKSLTEVNVNFRTHFFSSPLPSPPPLLHMRVFPMVYSALFCAPTLHSNKMLTRVHLWEGWWQDTR